MLLVMLTFLLRDNLETTATAVHQSVPVHSIAQQPSLDLEALAKQKADYEK